MERLTTQLRAFGLSISKRQVMRLLIDRQDAFLAESRDVLRAGLQTASWVTVDDTGARHAGRNGFCTQIGNDDFTWFGTRASKSRLNFLDLLRAGHTDLRRQRRGAGLHARPLARRPGASAAWPPRARRHASPTTAPGKLISSVSALPTCRSRPTPCASPPKARCGAPCMAHGFLRRSGDRQRRRRSVRHRPARAVLGACRAAGAQARHLHRPAPRRPGAHARADLVVLRRSQGIPCSIPSPRRRSEMRARFDRIFARRTGFAMLDRLLARLHANKPELLMVLDRPEIPLHTNGSERDIRCQVIKRKISGGTHSDTGRDCRDAFLGLMHTCAKLGIALLGLSRRPARGRRARPGSRTRRSHPLPRPASLTPHARGFAPVTARAPGRHPGRS